MPQRGDTENHWVMYYGSLYLMSEYWPDLPGSEWFTGKSSAENLAEAREYLIWWMDFTTSRGQGEYDCTHYIGEYLIPMLHLAAWAEDPEMRIRGQMMVDYLIADFAIDTLNGLYIGAHARTDDRQVLEKWNGLSTFFAWLFFNNTPRPRDSWGIYFAVTAQAYPLPEILVKIATDRDGPYLSRERKRTRERWRHSEERFMDVYKTTFVTKDYAIGSDQGGLLQPIQQHSWDVTWALEDPRGKHNTMFSIHPYWSEKEMQMYFAEYPDFMPASVTKQGKPTYMAGDTFLGGSEYERVLQHKDTIIALYDIAPDAPHHHINGFFSKDLDSMVEDPSGWIFAEAGRVYLAYRPLQDYQWDSLEGGGRRLVSPGLKNGTILQAASVDDFQSFSAFQERIRSGALEVDLDALQVSLTTWRGDRVVADHSGSLVVNGTRVIYNAWPLFDSPYLKAEVNSRMLEMRHGSQRRVLDFNRLEIRDRVIETDPKPFNIWDIRP